MKHSSDWSCNHVKMQTPAITLWFPVHRFQEQFLFGFFLLEKRLASPGVFLRLGGPAQNLPNFQMAPIPILSILTCSTSSPNNILKVLRKIIYHNLPVGRDKRDDWVLGGISCGIYVGFLLVWGELSLMVHFFFLYIPLFMIVICWGIYGIEWLKVWWKKSIGKCLFSVKKSFLAPTFAFFTVFYLFSPPNTLLICYYYQILCLDVVDLYILSIWHQDMWKESIGSFLYIGFPLFFYLFLAFFNVFLPILPCYTL